MKMVDERANGDLRYGNKGRKAVTSQERFSARSTKKPKSPKKDLSVSRVLDDLAKRRLNSGGVS